MYVVYRKWCFDSDRQNVFTTPKRFHMLTKIFQQIFLKHAASIPDDEPPWFSSQPLSICSAKSR